ncbi:hypothetical protein CANARDRAFT_29502 [[Candida] arabinofermentans NRRL YB-2248]|uniref:Extradiol ring-cleavage dioxygenase class III enzyme subunit B domain-containing protein n=1 Tax=[Candida] arabinofermentans NRRL YB-2248 TaxID=983967 RepID=A0A1E4SX48_9ASCO|nr:hypothetical protein CANARDRAFT_29502 [[Candida] arabinofermentans NRRL YB-2248]
MSIFTKVFYKSTTPYASKSLKKVMSTTTTSAILSSTTPEKEKEFKKTNSLPVYFFSHGGPTFADRGDPFGSDEGAWDKTKEIGDYIKNELKPDFMIVVSAHWQSNLDGLVEVSMPKQPNSDFYHSPAHKSKPILKENENDLIYDFYNFPDRHYRNQFHTKGDVVLANDIVNTLNEGGLKSKLTIRGIDHGVWVPLRVAFGDTTVEDTKKLDIDVPLIQVSLAKSDEIDIQYKLGQILNKYRGLNGLIICSGMSVHNLRDLGRPMPMGSESLPYVTPFNELLTKMLNTDGNVLDELKKLEVDPNLRKLYFMSHPTNEHFMPVAVGAGAALGDECKELYSGARLSLGWNIYRWGELPTDSNL